MAVRAQVPPEIVARLRLACVALPEAYEEPAWVGVRWRIRKETFAHVVMIDGGWPPAYAKAAGAEGPACVLTFRSRIAELDPFNYAEPPFFRPMWWPDIAGLFLDEATDWDEVDRLVAGSYCKLAPKTLAQKVEGAG
jgi:hypothetical protein